jgi:hypothetical protein
MVEDANRPAEHVVDALRRKDSVRRSLFVYAALSHDDHMVGILGRKVEIVQDGQHTDAVCGEGMGRLQHVVLMREVEAGGGLIEQQVAVPVGRR